MQLRAPTALPLAKADSGRDAASIDKAARGLEGEFARMLIKSMRSTALGDGDAMFPGAAGQYRDLYDNQLADSITRGRGLGLADMIRRQLGGAPAAAGTGAPAAALPLHAAPPAHAHALDAARPPSLPLPPRAPSAPVVPGTSPTWPRGDDWSAPSPGPARARPAPAVGGDPRVGSQAERFVAEVWPHAQRAARELGVDARTLVAQAALETGWGRRQIRAADGGSANNLFGIKAGGRWTGDSARNTTTEFVDGVARKESASFRAYASIADSFGDYVRLLKTQPRYAQAVQAGGDGRQFAQALQRAGYATDPHYADKLVAIAEGPTLRRALARL